jgi:hypothetical protein
MKRGLLIGVGTLGGLGAVFAITPPQFGTSGPTGLAALPGRAAAPSAAPSAESTKAATTPTKASSKPTKSAGAPKPAQTTPVASAGITGTFDGNTSQTRWGPVQVRIVVKDGKIVGEELLLKNVGRVRYVKMGPDGYLYIAVESPGFIFRLLPV